MPRLPKDLRDDPDSIENEPNLMNDNSYLRNWIHSAILYWDALTPKQQSTSVKRLKEQLARMRKAGKRLEELDDDDKI